MAIFILSQELVFPDPTLANKDGLLAVEGDLSPARLLLAYQNGIFPWYSHGEPILWWSPDPRLVLYPNDIKISRSLYRTVQRQKYRVSLDLRFSEVVHACANAGGRSSKGTWITSEMHAAYCDLHSLGFAHSVETWYKDQLVGGLYGVSLGHCFFGESMFSVMSDASKVALVALVEQLRKWNFHFIDCQVPSDHLYRMGAKAIPRHQFLRQLSKAIEYPTKKGLWHRYPTMES